MVVVLLATVATATDGPAWVVAGRDGTTVEFRQHAPPATITIQALVSDPAGAAGISATNGVQLSIQ